MFRGERAREILPIPKISPRCFNMELAERAEKIAKILADGNPNPKTELVHLGECQLMVAVMLSAQTTDKKVNQITPKLFTKYNSWEDFANANLTQLQADIHGVNFHLGKADRIIKAARMVLARFGGKLPRTMEELVQLPGIARKSANVLMQELWDVAEGIVVDTHVLRVSQRLGLTEYKEPVKIEKDLMSLLPKKYWRNFSSSLVLHGRYVCTARKPKCGECALNKLCPSAFKFE
jgi:endonuclease III